MANLISSGAIYPNGQHIVRSADDVLVACLHNESDGNAELYTSTDEGSSWSIQDTITSDLARDSIRLNPSLYLEGSNSLHVSYGTSSDQAYRTYTVNSDGTLTQGVDETISGGLFTTSSGHSDICVSPNGSVYIAHHVQQSLSSTNETILRQRNSGSWDELGNLSGGLDSLFVTIRADPSNDDVHGTFKDNANGDGDYRRWDDSQGQVVVENSTVHTTTDTDGYYSSYDANLTLVQGDTGNVDTYESSTGTAHTIFSSVDDLYTMQFGESSGDTFAIASDGVDFYVNETTGGVSNFSSGNEEILIGGLAGNASMFNQAHSMHYPSSGDFDALIEDDDNGEIYYRSFSVDASWGTTADWDNAQSESNVEHPNDEVFLAMQEDNFDSYTVGNAPPSPWVHQTPPNGLNTREVSDARGLSGSQSYYILDTSGGTNVSDEIAVFSYVDGFSAQKYTSFTFSYYETSVNQNTAYRVLDSSGNSVFLVGTNNPQVYYADSSGYNELVASPSPDYGAWRTFTVTLDWTNNEFDVLWEDIGGSTANASASNLTMIDDTSPTDVDRVELAFDDVYGDIASGAEVYMDDVTAFLHSSGTLKTDTDTS